MFIIISQSARNNLNDTIKISVFNSGEASHRRDG
jgi:hypothetical protein